MDKAYVRVNEAGQRIGEDHHMARLTDAEVDELLSDREAGFSYNQLMRKYGVSKSSVRDYVKGRRRAQVGPRVLRQVAQRTEPQHKVRINFVVPLHIRAKLHRLGGGKWLVKQVEGARCMKDRGKT